MMAFCLYLKRRELAEFMVGSSATSSSSSSGNSVSSSADDRADISDTVSKGNAAVIDLVSQLALIAALFQVSHCTFCTYLSLWLPAVKQIIL